MQNGFVEGFDGASARRVLERAPNAGKATRSAIVAPSVLPSFYQHRFPTLIKEVTTTGNSALDNVRIRQRRGAASYLLSAMHGSLCRPAKPIRWRSFRRREKVRVQFAHSLTLTRSPINPGAMELDLSQERHPPTLCGIKQRLK